MDKTVLDNNECLVKRDHLGYYEYVDICNNTDARIVKWTGLEYLAFIFCILVIVIFLFFAVAVIKEIKK